MYIWCFMNGVLVAMTVVLLGMFTKFRKSLRFLNKLIEWLKISKGDSLMKVVVYGKTFCCCK